jgi:two-component system phosphate regulon sensor histidine kinase PhoR
MSGLRGRIAITAAAASAAALVAVLLLVGPGLRRQALDHTRDALLAEARLMAHIVEEPLARGAGPEELDPLVDSAARDVRSRVTIIAPDGRVLADTALSGPALLAVENHAGRPEVREAVANGVGTSVRHSATVKENLVYAAVAVRRDGRLLGVSRVAFDLRGIDEQVAALRRSVALSLALAFAVTALLSVALSAPLAGPLKEIMDSARRLAGGDLSARTQVRRSDELGELATILNRSADQLQGRLTEIARDSARLQAILAAMDDGVLAVDHRGHVILSNDTLRRSLRLQDPLGRHYLEVVRHPQVERVLEEVLRTGERRVAEVALHHLRRLYTVTGVPFPGLEGTPHGAVLTFQDATERRRVDEIRRDFAANASHELRTPLTSIRGFVEALEDGAVADPPTSRRFLEKIRLHADRMAALITDLLELSRLESGERPPRWGEVAPRELLEEAAASLSSQAAAKKIEIDTTSDGVPSVVTDGARLRSILENLVENAVKYTPEGGRVDLTARPGPDATVLFEVADNGPGIAPEHLPRIFERFYRVDKARSRDLGGTGLGLAIVKHLAETMGAAVSVTSHVGEGTRFTVRVPPTPPA